MMKTFFKVFIIYLAITLTISLTACLDSGNQTSEHNNVSNQKSAASEAEIKQRQQQVFAEASEAPKQFREGLKENCPHFNSILLTTAETIQLGTRVFNASGISLTNRIYEGTVYKILFTIQDDCMQLSDALQAGISMAENEESYHDKAWALRNTLELIMGGSPLNSPGG